MTEKEKRSYQNGKIRVIAIALVVLAFLIAAARFWFSSQNPGSNSIPNIAIDSIDYASLAQCQSDTPLGIVYGGADGIIKLRNLQTQELTITDIDAGTLSYPGTLSVDMSPQRDMVVIDNEQYGRLPLSEHYFFVGEDNHQLLWSPQGTWLYTNNKFDNERGLYLINPQAWGYEQISTGITFEIVWSDSERYLAYIQDLGSTYQLVVYDVPSKEFVLFQSYERTMLSDQPFGEQLSFLGETLFVQSEEALERYNLETGASETILTGVSAGDFSPDGRWLKRFDVFYDLESSEEFDPEQHIGLGEWSPNSRFYAWVGEGRVHYFDVENRVIDTIEYPYPNSIYGPDWSPDSQYLVIRFDYDGEEFDYHYYNFVVSMATGEITVFEGTTITGASDRELWIDYTNESYAPIWSPNSVYIPYIMPDIETTFFLYNVVSQEHCRLDDVANLNWYIP